MKATAKFIEVVEFKNRSLIERRIWKIFTFELYHFIKTESRSSFANKFLKYFLESALSNGGQNPKNRRNRSRDLDGDQVMNLLFSFLLLFN